MSRTTINSTRSLQHCSTVLRTTTLLLWMSSYCGFIVVWNVLHSSSVEGFIPGPPTKVRRVNPTTIALFPAVMVSRDHVLSTNTNNNDNSRSLTRCGMTAEITENVHTLRPSTMTESSSSPSSTTSTSTHNNYNDGTQTKRRIHHHENIKNNNKMSKLEMEFYDLLTGIIYTQEEIQSVTNPRLRTILQGISASYDSYDVYRAFEVLYCDVPPLRVAGRLVYHKLRSVVNESIHTQQKQFQAVVDYMTAAAVSTTATDDTSNDKILIDHHRPSIPFRKTDLESCWETFLQLIEYEDVHDGKLSLQTLQRLMMETYSTDDIIESNTVQRVLHKLNLNNKDRLTFDELVINAYNFLVVEEDKTSTRLLSQPSKSSTTDGSTTNLLQHLVGIDDPTTLSSILAVSATRKNNKYNRRYDDMLEQFSEWKNLIPPASSSLSSSPSSSSSTTSTSTKLSSSRRMDIMRGCFVGAENPKVVEALRVIYVDFAALRVSGDWIFKTVSLLMRNRIASAAASSNSSNRLKTEDG